MDQCGCLISGIVPLSGNTSHPFHLIIRVLSRLWNLWWHRSKETNINKYTKQQKEFEALDHLARKRPKFYAAAVESHQPKLHCCCARGKRICVNLRRPTVCVPSCDYACSHQFPPKRYLLCCLSCNRFGKLLDLEHSSSVNGLSWAPHSASHICTAGEVHGLEFAASCLYYLILRVYKCVFMFPLRLAVRAWVQLQRIE